MSATAPNTPVHGGEGRVAVNGMILTSADTHEVDDNAQDIEATGFEDIGPDGQTYENGTTGKRVANVTITAFWVAEENPAGNPPNFKPGQFLVNVLCYIRKTGNLRWRFPRFKVLSFKSSTRTGDKVAVTITGKSQGIFYRPGQAGS